MTDATAFEDVERQLIAERRLMDAMPAPALLYTADGRIDWCNRPMLNLFWGTLAVPSYHAPSAVWGKYCKDVMPDYLWPYVIEQNNKVFQTKAPQYEDWSDETWVGVKWRCLRFYVDAEHVGVILFPHDESHLSVCAEALAIKH